MDEPSVLDFVKDRLAFWRPARLHIPMPDEVLAPPEVESQFSETAEEVAPETQEAAIRLPWLPLAGIFLALFGQVFLEPKFKNPAIGIPLYLVAAVLILIACRRGDWLPAEIPLDRDSRPADNSLRVTVLLSGMILAMAAFIFFGSEQFNWINTSLWLLSILLVALGFWQPRPDSTPGLRLRIPRTAEGGVAWRVWITPWTLLLALAFGLILFFRFYQLDQVPLEMVSDHAEKLLDVSDVLNGSLNIYFPRNTGREFLQFYLTAAVVLLFKTGISFMALKVGTAIASLATMPFIYLLGKEIGNRWVGLFAMLMAGIAYWTNMFTRIGLRFALYPLFAAPCLFFLIRGLRTRNRNDFIFAGIALGLGLHGYTSFRIVPILVVIAFGLFLLHRQSRGFRKESLVFLVVLVMLSLVVFIPLLRYSTSHPDLFAYRAFTRLADWERPLPDTPLVIFFQNLWNALTMFFWSDGEIWVHSVPYRPALDFISAALFFCGLVLLVYRYATRRNWLDLFLLVSIPVLMLPSILSLAFPAENPSLNRTAGAIIPVFLIAAIALDGLFTAIRKALPGKGGTGLAWLLGLSLLVMSTGQNFNLVFNQYNPVYRASTWNTSEMGEVIRGFANSIGSPNSAWVVGYPYWVDTRLVGINAGFPAHDYAIFPEQIGQTRSLEGPKLFILNTQDTTGQEILTAVYPEGRSRIYQSATPGKDFLIYLVIPTDGSREPPLE